MTREMVISLRITCIVNVSVMKYKQETHLFEIDSKSCQRYNELCKEARIWDNMGQYWLAKQTNLLAKQLLDGDASVVNDIVKSEDHFWKTKKFM